MNLAGRVAIVTGAGSGIGRAIALRFAEAGATVAVVGQRLARLEETRALAGERSAAIRPIAIDVASEASVAQAFAAVLRELGRLDVLVNNAAKNRPEGPSTETVAEMDPRWWDATLAVTLSGAFLCARAAIPHLVASGGGAIVNIASTSGIAGNRNQGAYIAAKHGMVGLTRSIALDYAARQIRCNAICPGFIETERSLKFSALNRGPQWRATKLAEIPLGRLGRAEEVAELALFLASDAAAFITGAVIPIDGGTAAKRG